MSWYREAPLRKQQSTSQSVSVRASITETVLLQVRQNLRHTAMQIGSAPRPVSTGSPLLSSTMQGTDSPVIIVIESSIDFVTAFHANRLRQTKLLHLSKKIHFHPSYSILPGEHRDGRSERKTIYATTSPQ
jgi:hypothetical protein